MSAKELEKRYGIKILDDSYYNPLTGKIRKAYKFFTADGCLWENGLRTIKDIEKECRTWKVALLEIKNKMEVA